MGDEQAPIGEVFYIEGASSYKQDSGALIEATVRGELVNDENCSFCKRDLEDIVHFFVNVYWVKGFGMREHNEFRNVHVYRISLQEKI